MSYKNANAERTTVTRDVDKIEAPTGNIYESIVVISRRAGQLAGEMREELTSKLQEFATHTDNLEEVFENREQIEISRHYEKQPKPVAIAIQEFIEGGTYFRYPEQQGA